MINHGQPSNNHHYVSRTVIDQSKVDRSVKSTCWHIGSYRFYRRWLSSPSLSHDQWSFKPALLVSSLVIIYINLPFLTTVVESLSIGINVHRWSFTISSHRHPLLATIHKHCGLSCSRILLGYHH